MYASVLFQTRSVRAYGGSKAHPLICTHTACREWLGKLPGGGDGGSVWMRGRRQRVNRVGGPRRPPGAGRRRRSASSWRRRWGRRPGRCSTGLTSTMAGRVNGLGGGGGDQSRLAGASAGGLLPDRRSLDNLHTTRSAGWAHRSGQGRIVGRPPGRSTG
jgi:hypothetical protein